MKRILIYLRKISWERKIILLFLGISIFPFLLFSVFTLESLKTKNIENILLTTQKNYEQTYSYLNYRFYRLYRTAVMICTDNEVREICSKRPGAWSVYEITGLSNKLISCLDSVAYDQEIKDAMFYVEDSSLYVSENGKIRDIDYLLSNDKLKEVIGDGKSLCWTNKLYQQENKGKIEYLSAFRKIVASNNFLEDVAYLRLDVEKPDFDIMLKRCTTVEGQLVYLIGHNGELMCCNDEMLYEKIQPTYESIKALWRENQKTNTLSCVNKTQYYISCEEIESANCFFISLIPKISVHKSGLKLIYPILSLMLIVLCTVIIFCCIIKKYFIHRVFNLINGINQIESGIEEIVSPIYDDEIGKTIRLYNKTVKKLQELMEKQLQMGKQMKQLELSALQTQINPHFLYNTLDAIQWKEQEHNSEEVQDMLRNLSSYYKLVLNKGEDSIFLGKEVELCRLYVSLLNKRFENSIQLILEVEESVKSCLLPKITIQPLVENSVYHGIRETASQKGIIKIKAWQKDELLFITVSDDGVGFIVNGEQEEFLKNIESPHDKGSHYGIKSVEERLCLYFGVKQAMALHSIPGLGTTIEICIPIKIE